MALTIDPARDMLLVVDPQPTFMALCPDELPVPGAEAVIAPINRLLGGVFPRAVVTQDWHGPDHLSFASQHPGRKPYEVVEVAYGSQVLWPDHAVRGSRGAAIHPDLDLTRVALILRKGMRREIDSYSAFRENDHVTGTGLAEWLRGVGIRRVFIAGITRPYCVDWSAADAAALGFECLVIEDACACLGPQGPLDDSRRALEAQGVPFITIADLL